MKRILFVNQDMIPYVDETEIATMGKVVPQKIQEAGNEIRCFMPCWGNINERRGQLHEVIRLSGINISINDTDHPLIIKVASIPGTKMQVYFIDNEEFYGRKGQTKDDKGKEYEDNGERAIFFGRGVVETIKKLRWMPEVIVCQGWMAGFLPIIIKQLYKDEPTVCNSKVVTIMYSDSPKKAFQKNIKDCLCHFELDKKKLAKYKDKVDAKELIKMTIDNSDAIIIGSSEIDPTILEDIKASGIKHLEYSGENFVKQCNEFLQNL